MAATVANSTDYLYNALGQMIEKSGTVGTTVLMQDESGHLLGEYNGSGQLVEETVWLGDIPVATLQPNGSGGVNIFYVHTDHLNAPRKVAQPTTGTLAWRWDADPFGTAAPNQNPAGLGSFPYNIRFPGQYYQAETGQSQNTQRDYDAITGRYIESDPIGLRGGSYSTYSYVRNNPAKFIDPTGLCGDEPESSGEVKPPKFQVCPIPLGDQPLTPTPGIQPCSVGCQDAMLRKIKSCHNGCVAGTGVGGVGACEEAWRIRLPLCVADCSAR